jgi:hypothetical protein
MPICHFCANRFHKYDKDPTPATNERRCRSCGDWFAACEDCIFIPLCYKPFCHVQRDETVLDWVKGVWNGVSDTHRVLWLNTPKWHSEVAKWEWRGVMAAGIRRVILENGERIRFRYPNAKDASAQVDLFLKAIFLEKMPDRREKPRPIPWYKLTNLLLEHIRWQGRQTRADRVLAIQGDGGVDVPTKALRIARTLVGCFQWKRSNESEFPALARAGKLEDVDDDVEINCWDAVLYVGYLAGAFTAAQMCKAYSDGQRDGLSLLGTPKKQGDQPRNWLQDLQGGDAWMNAVAPGDVFRLDVQGEAYRHVMLYLGGGQFMSHWSQFTGNALGITDKQAFFYNADGNHPAVAIWVSSPMRGLL